MNDLNLFNIFKKIELEKKVYVIKNYFESNFTWEDAVSLLDIYSKKEIKTFIDILDRKDMGIIKGEVLHRPIGFFQFSIEMPLEKKYDYINKVVSKLFKNLNHGIVGKIFGQIFMNITGLDYTSGAHRDNWGLFYVQLLGEVKWDILDDNLNIVQSKILRPGDVLLMPKGVRHEVIPLTPRVSLSVGVNSVEGTYLEYIEE